MKRDDIFSKPLEKVNNFEFDAKTASVFDDMIFRSVPLYLEVQRATVCIVAKLRQEKACVLDLGCSTGTTLLGLIQAIPDVDIKFIGVDNSSPMLSECRKKLSAEKSLNRVTLIEDDIVNFSEQSIFQNNFYSSIILNYTLQFIKAEYRLNLLKRLYEKILPGGALIITEKIKFEDSFTNQLMISLHHDLKRSQGYSDLEIAQKRDALEQVLIPFTLEQNLSLLRQAGFNDVAPFLQLYNFVSIVASKR